MAIPKTIEVNADRQIFEELDDLAFSEMASEKTRAKSVSAKHPADGMRQGRWDHEVDFSHSRKDIGKARRTHGKKIAPERFL